MAFTPVVVWTVVLRECTQSVDLLGEQDSCLPARLELSFALVTYYVLSYRACLSFWTEYHLKKNAAGFLLTQYTLNYKETAQFKITLFFSLFFVQISLQLRNVLITLLGLPTLLERPGKSHIKAGWWWIVLVWEKAVDVSPALLEVCFSSLYSRWDQVLFSGFLERLVMWCHLAHTQYASRLW